MIPKGLHCLPLRLTTEYYTLNSSQHDSPNQEKLEDPQLYHYAIFSDNVLAAAVVVNSTITYAKDPLKHVFHIVTDRLNYAAMRMWFLVNPPGKASIQVQNIEEFTWLNASYSPVLKQLGPQSVIDYYFRAHQANSDSNLKYRNPKYLSVLNHLRFYLPEIFPELNKVLFLNDDIVVKKDLTALRSLDLKVNVNGAVETCGESFHRFDWYLNFSNPLISKNFDPHACGWAYGMNIFDLDQWKRQNFTGVYHRWQKLLLELVEFKLREVISREPTLLVLVVGVPNFGKLALINSIHQIASSRFPVQEKMKRATVGPLPGVTQDIAGYKIAHLPSIYVLDTPGVLVPSIPDIETGLKLALAGIIVVTKVQCALYLTLLEITGNVEDESDLESLIEQQFEALQKAFKIPHKAPEACLMVSKKLLTLFRAGKLRSFILDDVLDANTVS